VRAAHERFSRCAKCPSFEAGGDRWAFADRHRAQGGAGHRRSRGGGKEPIRGEPQENPAKQDTKTEADAPAPSSAAKLEYWGDLVGQLVENRGSLRGFMQTSSCERLANGSFVIHVQTPFAVNMVSRPEVLSSIKNLISSREGVNLTGASVEVKAENGTSKISYFDEIEQALNH
jgi:hypothetical protein